MAKPIPLHTLNNGVKIPLLGFGTFAKGRTAGLSYDAVIAALDAGYRHFDCAWFYNNEDEIGAALKDWLLANPNFTRSDIFITTKVWLHLCGSPEDVAWSLNDSLRKLGTDYVDCFLIHWPICVEKTVENMPKIGPDGKYVINKHITANPEIIWKSVESLYKSGKARSIGVSNWTIKRLEKLLTSCEIKPVINQIEIHPFLPNTEIVDYCLSHDILPMAFSPLGSQHEIPITKERMANNPGLNALANSRGISFAQLLIAWGLKRGYGVLPKSTSAERIKANFNLVDLSDADFEAVNKITEGRNHRFCALEYIFGYDSFAIDD